MSNLSGAGDLSLGGSSLTGLTLAISKYATLISITLTATGILVGVFFHYLALVDRRRQLKIDEQLLKINHNGEKIMPSHTPAERRKNKPRPKPKTKPKSKI